MRSAIACSLFIGISIAKCLDSLSTSLAVSADMKVKTYSLPMERYHKEVTFTS